MAEPFDLGALKRKAEQATPGPWRVREHDDSAALAEAQTCYSVHAGAVSAHGLDEHDVVDVGFDRDYYTPEGGIPKRPDAEYIAACSPDRLLALHAQLLAFRQWLVKALVECEKDDSFDPAPAWKAGGIRDALAEFDACVSLDAREGE